MLCQTLQTRYVIHAQERRILYFLNKLLQKITREDGETLHQSNSIHPLIPRYYMNKTVFDYSISRRLC